MPILREIEVDKKAKFYLWRVDETIEELEENLELSEYCIDRLDKMKVDSAKKNFLASRQILKLENYHPSDMYYDDNGKPFLSDGKKISISHSGNFVGVIFSDLNVGIDIEFTREKIVQIVQKFSRLDLHTTTISKSNMLLKLTKIWSAKEAVYKAHNLPGLNLKNQILVKNIFPSDMSTEVKVIVEDSYTSYKVQYLSIEEVDGLVVCYCYPS